MAGHPSSKVSAIKGEHVIVGEGTRISPSASIWNLVHIGQRVTIGDRVVVGSLVHIGSEVQIGEESQIEGGAYIADLTKIGRGCFLGPHVTITNDPFPPVRRKTGVKAWKGVVIEDGAVIGAGACLKAGVRIGARAVVGMGAVVTCDVPAETVVAGSPARVMYDRDEYDARQAAWAMPMNIEARNG